jgi:hypothetical protein
MFLVAAAFSLVLHLPCMVMGWGRVNLSVFWMLLNFSGHLLPAGGCWHLCKNLGRSDLLGGGSKSFQKDIRTVLASTQELMLVSMGASRPWASLISKCR